MTKKKSHHQVAMLFDPALEGGVRGGTIAGTHGWETGGMWIGRRGR
jgi:hypothetical protein